MTKKPIFAYTLSYCLVALLTVFINHFVMASIRSKPQLKVGSAQWILAEKEQIMQFADQEAEEFTFSARNEMEWLNEHMAEVFDENQM